MGSDCDDGDPMRAASCAVEDCDKNPYAQGCSCQGSAAHACFSGSLDEATLGTCRAGTQYCTVGQWTACEGEISPSLEVCNGEDDDCDGRSDEGALSPCGGCNKDCVGAVWGSDEYPFAPKAPLVVDDTGALTLADETVAHDVVWVANTEESTLSLVDAKKLQHSARYALPGRPWRIAMDYEQSALVLSQSDSEWYLTKVASVNDLCVDRDGDGLNTSQNADDVLSLGADDCVLWSNPIADAAAGALALAVDGTRTPDGPAGGDVWVGTATPPQLRRYSGVDGTAGTRVKFDEGVLPQDASFDLLGQLWMAGQHGELVRVAYNNGRYRASTTPVPSSCHELEALAIDTQGRPVLSTYACESVLRFEPSSENFSEVMAPGLLPTRGIAVSQDAIYVTHTAGAISSVLTQSLSFVDTRALEGSLGALVEAVGLSMDDTGSLWVTSRAASRTALGVLSYVDADSLELIGQLEVGIGPRALGDFAGGRVSRSYADEGSIRQRFMGCDDGSATQWLGVYVRYQGGEGSHVEIEARSAPTSATLSNERFAALGVAPTDSLPFDLSEFTNGGVLELRLTLRSGGHIGAPRVSQVGVRWRCEGPN